jgi:hypothetical protein
MLELDESLFVEHKGDLGDGTSQQLAKSVSAFANTLGGWLLIGVTNGRPNGSTAPWTSDRGPTLADSVRDRLRGLVDPLPPFEAARLQHPDGMIGVVRVYESSDTPHVTLQSGAVFVREGAGDTDTANAGKAAPGARGQRVYEARQIRSRQQLLDLAARGAQAERRVELLLDPARPLALTNRQLALSPPGAPSASRQPYVAERGATIFVRLAPLTLPRGDRYRAIAGRVRRSSSPALDGCGGAVAWSRRPGGGRLSDGDVADHDRQGAWARSGPVRRPARAGCASWAGAGPR